MTRTIEVLGLGNALVDILAHADDAYLEAQDMVKGAMTLIDEDRAEALYAARVDPVVVSGGSAANTIVGVASLGVASRLYRQGQARPARRSVHRRHPLDRRRFDTHPAEHGPATGRCFVYVTPDGERTMNTFLGASTYLAPPDVDEDARARGARSSISKATCGTGRRRSRPSRRRARSPTRRGRRVALTLSDSFCVDRFRGEFIDLMRSKTVDTIFANTDELLSLYETPHFDEALDALRAEGVLGVVTRSAKGCVVVEGEDTWEAPAFPIERLVDTTGAGDMFAAGFLAGLARGRDMTTCGRLGALAAAEIIQHLGARPQAPLAALAAEAGLSL